MPRRHLLALRNPVITTIKRRPETRSGIQRAATPEPRVLRRCHRVRARRSPGTTKSARLSRSSTKRVSRQYRRRSRARDEASSPAISAAEWPIGNRQPRSSDMGSPVRWPAWRPRFEHAAEPGRRSHHQSHEIAVSTLTVLRPAIGGAHLYEPSGTAPLSRLVEFPEWVAFPQLKSRRRLRDFAVDHSLISCHASRNCLAKMPERALMSGSRVPRLLIRSTLCAR